MVFTISPYFLYPFMGSTATCAYVHMYELRGDVFILCISLTYLGLIAQHFIATGVVLESLLHATRLTAIYLGFAALETVAYRLSPLHPLATFPGPLVNKITSIRMAVAAASGKRHVYVADLHKKYGVFVRVAPNKLSINSLTAVTPIYASSQAFDKSENYRPGRTSDGSLFFIQNRTEHNHRMRVWAPAFTPAALQEGAEILNDRTKQLVECVANRKDASGAVNIGHCIDHWTFDLMGDLTFGGSNHIEFMQDGDPSHTMEGGQASIVLFEILGEIPSLFDICSLLPVNDAYRGLERLAARLLKTRKEVNPKNALDLCSLFLAQRDDHPYPPLNDVDLQADTVFAIAAGSDTTAAMATIILFYLLRHKSTYDRLNQELDTHFPTGEITPEDHTTLLTLPYLTAVISEGLRFGSPFPGFPRVVPKGGAVIDGRYVPGGTIVAVPTYAQHTSEDNFYPATGEFKPERWLEGGIGAETMTRKEALMAFQFGPFGCLGKPLALRQLSVVLAHLILAYDLAFAPDFSPKAFVDGWTNFRTNVLKYPLKVQAVPRMH